MNKVNGIQVDFEEMEGTFGLEHENYRLLWWANMVWRPLDPDEEPSPAEALRRSDK